MFFFTPLHFITHTLVNPIPLMPYMPSLGSNGPYYSVLGINFSTWVAPTTIRRVHNKGISKFQVNTYRKKKNTTTLSPARNEWL